VREEGEEYRRGLTEPVGHVVVGTSQRLLVVWRAEGLPTCPDCPPAPPVIGISILRLPPSGVVPFSALPAPRSELFRLRVTFNVACIPDPTPGPYYHRIRMRPSEKEVFDRRSNPYGPAERADGSAGFYSDGETIWRYDPTDPAAPPDSLGPGAFPALSPDGLTLAAAVPVGLDSTSSVCLGGICCFQETVVFGLTGWDVVLYDAEAGTSLPLGSGVEPVFDPLGGRLVARRPDGLYWMDLATGAATVVVGTEGGYAPAVSPDGSLLAFTASRFDSPDVFYVRLR
jgi:hypothetical protein